MTLYEKVSATEDAMAAKPPRLLRPGPVVTTSTVFHWPKSCTDHAIEYLPEVSLPALILSKGVARICSMVL
jgi:hypothetical protein